MKIAITTCVDRPEGTPDDALLVNVLRARGHEVENIVWSEAAVDWSTFDLVSLRSPWDYYKKLDEFLSWAKRVTAATRLVNTYATVVRNARKDYLLDLARRRFPVVPSFTAASAEGALRIGESMLARGPLVVKPAVSGGSYLTSVVRDGAELVRALPALVGHGAVLLQPFVESVASDGEISLVYFRPRGVWTYSHAVLKRAAGGDFRVQTEFGGSVEAFAPSKEHLFLSESLLEQETAAGDLYARVDLVDWRTAPKLGELELIEPALFFEFGAGSAEAFAEVLEETEAR